MGLFDRFRKQDRAEINGTSNGLLGPDVNVIRVGNEYLSSPKLHEGVSTSAKNLHKRAQEAFLRGDIQSAMNAYSEAIKVEPRWYLPYYESGVVLDRLEQYEQASHFYEKSIELEPTWPAAYYNLAVYFKKIGDYTASLNLLARYVTMDPTDPDGHMQIASVLMHTGDTDKENHALENVLKLDPTHVIANLNLGINKLNAGDRNRAKKHFLKVLEHAPAGSAPRESALLNIRKC